MGQCVRRTYHLVCCAMARYCCSEVLKYCRSNLVSSKSACPKEKYLWATFDWRISDWSKTFSAMELCDAKARIFENFGSFKANPLSQPLRLDLTSTSLKPGYL